jgi:hypothetical protein
MSSRAIPVRHNKRANNMTIKTNATNAIVKSAVATIIKADGSIAKAIETLAAAGFTYAYCSQPPKGCNDPKHKVQYSALMDGLHYALAKGPTIAALKVEKKKRTPAQVEMVTTLNQLCGTYKFRIKEGLRVLEGVPKPVKSTGAKAPANEGIKAAGEPDKSKDKRQSFIVLADNTYGLALKLLSATGDGNSERLAALDAALAQIKKALAREAK